MHQEVFSVHCLGSRSLLRGLNLELLSHGFLVKGRQFETCSGLSYAMYCYYTVIVTS